MMKNLSEMANLEPQRLSAPSARLEVKRDPSTPHISVQCGLSLRQWHLTAAITIYKNRRTFNPLRRVVMRFIPNSDVSLCPTCARSVTVPILQEEA